MNYLIEALRRKQNEERITGEAMAARLGMSGAHWSRLMSGEREFTRETLSRVLLLWSELGPEVLEYLENGG